MKKERDFSWMGEGIDNHFTFYGLGEGITDQRAFNVLRRVEKREILNTNIKITDLEGMSIDDIMKLRQCGAKSAIIILSHYLSHGYVVDKNGRLKKNFDKKQNDLSQLDSLIGDDTLLESFLDKRQVEKLKMNGFVKVGDLVGSDYCQILGILPSDNKAQREENVKLWFDIVSKLAGAGYVFSSDSTSYGKILKGNVEYYPDIELSETEKEKNDRLQKEKEQKRIEQEEQLGCSTCDKVKQLELELEKIKRERDNALTSLQEKNEELRRVRETNISLLDENLKLEKKANYLKNNNDSLRESLGNAAEALRPYLKKRK